MKVFFKLFVIFLLGLSSNNLIAQIVSPSLSYAKSIFSVSFQAQNQILQVGADASGNWYALVQMSIIPGTQIDFDNRQEVSFYPSTGSPANQYVVKYNNLDIPQWVVPLNVAAQTMLISNVGEVYLSGNFTGVKDFNPEVGVSNLTQVGGVTNSYFLKLSPTGIFQWARSLSGNNSTVYEMKIDAADQLIVTGSFTSSVDFDFNAGTSNGTTTGGFIACYTSTPTLSWVRFFNGSTVGSFDFDNSGNIVLALSFSGTTDLDPGAGTVSVTSAGANDWAIVKLTNAGVYIASFKVGGAGMDNADRLVTDATGDIYIIGRTQTTAAWDINPGAAINNIPIGSYCILTKFTSSLAFSWVNTIGTTATTGTLPVFGTLLEINKSNGDLYCGGILTTAANIDFDPSASTRNLITNGTNGDWFLASYNSSGNYIFANAFGFTNITDDIYDLFWDSFNNTIKTAVKTGGANNKTDIDPSASTVNIVQGLVYYDVNGNYQNQFLIYSHSFEGYFNPKVILPCESGNLYCITELGSVGADQGIFFIDAQNYNYSTSANSTNLIKAMIVKLDASGNVLRTQIFQYSNSGLDTKFAVDDFDNLYFAGEYNSNFDADPGLSTDNLTVQAAGVQAVAVIKFDSSLVYQWSFGLKANSNVNLKDLSVSNNEAVLSLEVASGATLFSLTPWTTATNVSLNATTRTVIARYSGSKTLVSGFTLEMVTAPRLTCAKDGSFYVYGQLPANTVDFDPVLIYNLSGNGKTFVVKYSPTNAILASSMFDSNINPTALISDENNDCYLYGDGGSITAATDVQPGFGITNVPNAAGSVYVIKLNASLLFQWANEFGTNLMASRISAVANSKNLIVLSDANSNVTYLSPFGSTIVGNTNFDLQLFCLNSQTGAFQWCNKLNPPGTTSNYSNGILAITADHFYLANYFNESTIRTINPLFNYNVSTYGLSTDNTVLLRLNFPGLLSVSGNSQYISPEDYTPSLLDDTDFGNSVASGIKQKTFRIRNTGISSLNINSIGITNPKYSITGITFPYVLAPNTFVDVTVSFQSSVLGLNSSNIQINTIEYLQGYRYGVQCQVGPMITIANGNWSNPATWLDNTIPNANGDAIIAHAVNLDQNYTTGAYNLTIQNNKSLNIKNTRVFTLSSGGTLNNNGVVITNVGGSFINNGTMNNSGIFHDWELTTNNNIWNNSGIINNTKNFTNASLASLNNTGTINNNLSFTNPGTLTNLGIVNNNAGNFNNNGTIDNNLGVYNNNLGATLSGAGIYNGYLANDGTFAPGNSPGVFTINGMFVNNGDINIEIGGDNGAGDPNGHDRIIVNGDVYLGGNVNVTLINGFTPASGSVYNFITGTSVFNTFVLENLPGAGWTVPYAANGADAKYDGALPVELLNFSGLRINNEKVDLKWLVTMEQNLQFYEVERRLESENQFVKVGTKNAEGFAAYSLTDHNNFTGNSYYRLKMINLDGSFKYSNTVLVGGNPNTPTISVYPNPSIGIFNLTCNHFESNIEISVIDVLGRTVFEKTIEPTQNQTIAIDLQNEAKGFYTLKIKSNATEINQKMIID